LISLWRRGVPKGGNAAPRDTLSYNASKDYRLRLVSLSNEVGENSKNNSFRNAAEDCQEQRQRNRTHQKLH
jgi:hypothetical protein